METQTAINSGSLDQKIQNKIGLIISHSMHTDFSDIVLLIAAHLVVFISIDFFSEGCHDCFNVSVRNLHDNIAFVL